MQKLSLFLLFFWSLSFATGQVDSSQGPVFMEKASAELFRFYFDDSYYLLDKNCRFKFIERVSGFDTNKNVFDGAFTDFDQNGTVVLSGHYEHGLKQGVFTAYHPNAALKWEVTFEADKPTGNWHYYYPDGKPMLTVYYDNSGGKIIDFWDRKGRQRVKAGEGNYAFQMPFVFYNEYGYPFYERRGRIKNGLPYGYWTNSFVDEKGAKTLYTEESYDQNGMMTEGYNLFLDATYESPFGILPTSSFYTAESLLAKPCTFDDHSGFNTYLAQKFDALLAASPSLHNIEDHFSYEVQLSAEGVPEKSLLKDSLQTQELNPYLEAALKEIPFYFPSVDQAENAMADQLRVYGKLSIDASGRFHFHSFRIERGNQP